MHQEARVLHGEDGSSGVVDVLYPMKIRMDLLNCLDPVDLLKKS